MRTRKTITATAFALLGALSLIGCSSESGDTVAIDATNMFAKAQTVANTTDEDSEDFALDMKSFIMNREAIIEEHAQGDERACDRAERHLSAHSANLAEAAPDELAPAVSSYLTYQASAVCGEMGDDYEARAESRRVLMEALNDILDR